MSVFVTRESILRSTFIILGTVVKLNATTSPDIPVVEDAIVVKVVEVLQTTPGLGDYEGKIITVRLPPGHDVKVSDNRIFYTKTWIVGRSLAFTALDYTTALNTDTLRSQVEVTTQIIADRALKARIENAHFIITGKVIRIKRATLTLRRGPVTLHDADWHEAHVDVKSVHKGKLVEKRIVVHFPNNPDMFWGRFPKFKEGDESVLFLRKGKITELFRISDESGKMVPQGEGYAALHLLDVHDKKELERITRLVKAE